MQGFGMSSSSQPWPQPLQRQVNIFKIKEYFSTKKNWLSVVFWYSGHYIQFQRSNFKKDSSASPIVYHHPNSPPVFRFLKTSFNIKQKILFIKSVRIFSSFLPVHLGVW